MTIKATSLLSILVIWACMIPAVAIDGDAWWSLIFAFLATGSVGIGAWRRLGLSRLIAISGVWAGTAAAVASDPDSTWISIFAFLSTAAVVYSIMRRTAVVTGLGIGAVWAMVGAVIAAHGAEGSWIAVFAFLTAGSLANSRRGNAKGFAAMLWWGIAGGIMLAAGGWYFLSVFAFILTTASLGFTDFRFPRGLEWDLFERDDDARLVN